MATKATLRRNGRRMVTVRVAAHFDAVQLAALLWKGCDLDARRERTRIPAAQVRSAVAEYFAEQGDTSSFQVENDDDWEFKDGRDWALDQVMRVYGFTESDLDAYDRERRAARRTET